MQYMGSKNRLAKHIVPVLNSFREEGQVYIEPFAGGMNMIDKMSGHRIANDSHTYLIDMWKSLCDGWIPPTQVSREMYYQIKSTPQQFDSALVGFVGFLCSFGGKWWGGYAFNSKGDNYAEMGSRCLLKQAKNMKGVSFLNTSYDEIEYPEGCLIYCDPPYKGTTSYSMKFDHDKFWKWVERISSYGRTVLVSEYSAPDNFEEVLTIPHKTILDKNSNYVRTEKLFRLRLR